MMKKKVVIFNLRKIFLFFITAFIIMCSLRLVFSEELMEEQAIKYFKEALESQKSGDIDYAISLYTKAIYAKSNYAKAHNNLGTAYAQKGDRAKAEERYNQAIMIDPYYSIALKNLAIIYAERGDYERFYEYWKRATGLDIYSPFIIDEEDED